MTAMHYSIDCYVAKAFNLISEVSAHSTQAIHAWHVAIYKIARIKLRR